MDIHDYVFVINRDDRFYGYKFKICGVQQDFFGTVTGYTVQDGFGRYWRDYDPSDLQYTTQYRKKFSPQMQLL
jgi:hypothetical protein